MSVIQIKLYAFIPKYFIEIQRMLLEKTYWSSTWVMNGQFWIMIELIHIKLYHKILRVNI